MMSNDEEDEFDECCTPEALRAFAVNAKDQVIPQKSKERYEQIYSRYLKWRRENNANKTSKNVLLAYFNQLSSTMAPNTLWSIWSVLKKMLEIRENVNIVLFPEVKAFVKAKNKGYRPKKAKVFSDNDIERFLTEAPNDTYLLHEVVIVFGLNGAMRMGELVQLERNDIAHAIDNETKQPLYIVRIRPEITKTNMERVFTISRDIREDFYTYVQEYLDIRSKANKLGTNRLILNYKNGKCNCQHLGINKIRRIPKQIAIYLKITNPGTYTGHSLRRTSATKLANNGADMIMLFKRLGGWLSDSAAQGYIDDSTYPRRNIEKTMHRFAPTVTCNQKESESSVEEHAQNQQESESIFEDYVVNEFSQPLELPEPTRHPSNTFQFEDYVVNEFSQPLELSEPTRNPSDTFQFGDYLIEEFSQPFNVPTSPTPSANTSNNNI